jgi:Double-GTPase 1
MNPNFVIMGLPESGKTTFLAALWHIIEAEEKQCRLKLDRFEGSLIYLNTIAEAWRTFKPVERTSHTGDTDVTMYLLDSITGTKGIAFFPDIAGERFSDQVEVRRSRRAFIDNVEEGDGILLFVNANSKQDYLSIVELNDMMPPEPETSGGVGTDDANTALAGAAGRPQNLVPEKVPDWEPKHIPGQVRIVQMLSDLLRAPFETRTRRLAVIVSAWDLVLRSGMSPNQWIEGNMPLVDQFLRTNGDYFDSRVYGVSAQGIDLNDRQAVERASKSNPSERILIVDGSERGHDITAPLVWLMADG